MKYGRLIPLLLVLGLTVSDIGSYQVYGSTNQEEENIEQATEILDATEGTEAEETEETEEVTEVAPAAEKIMSTATQEKEVTPTIRIEKNCIVGGSVGGYFVTKSDMETEKYKAASQNSKMNTVKGGIPSSYRNKNIGEVRNQNPYGTCWAFSALGLAEADLIKDGNKDVDLSELHLTYFNYNSVADPLGGTKGDKNYVTNSSDNNYLTLGGDYEQAMYTLLSWKGASLETNEDYLMAESSLTTGIHETRAYTQFAHLQNSYVINIRQNPEIAKEMIMTYGGVGICYCESKDYYYKDKNCYYTCGKYTPSYANHAVMVVGWDDNFSRNNFTGSSKPEKNGAWLIRNSWGSDKDSHGGYFWVSYEETSIVNSAYAFNMVDSKKTDFYDNNYQYDGGFDGSTMYLSGVDKIYMANTFKVSACKAGETLKAVGSFFTLTNVNYEVFIYKNPAADDPSSGTLVSSQKGLTTYKGYYTIPLKKTVDFAYGDTYSVVIQMYTESGVAGSFGVPIEYQTKNKYWTIDTNIQPGQSFYGYHPLKSSSAIRWTDICEKNYKGNIRIKAYTNNKGESEVKDDYTVSYSLNGGMANPANPVSYNRGKKHKLYAPVYGDTEFLGWYTDNKYKNKVTEISSSSSGNLTLYARWKDMEPNDVGLASPKIKTVDATSGYATVNWKTVEGADGYYIYRKVEKGKWKKIDTIATNATDTYYDETKLSNGKKYQYKVTAYLDYADDVIKSDSKAAICYYLTAPKLKSAKKKSGRSITFKFKKNSKATGYQLQYSTSKTFKKAKTYSFTKLSKKISGLKKGKKYYLRVRSYKKSGSVKYTGAWNTYVFRG